MRGNTYVKLETVYKKYRGYVGTKALLEEGFSNRQIAALAEEGYLGKIYGKMKKWERRHPIMGIVICTILGGVLISLVAGIILEIIIMVL